MANNICKKEGKKLLMVEGINDCHVIMSLCLTFKVPDDAFVIYECGGDEEVLKRFNGLLIGSESPDIIGVILDADKPNLMGRWSSIINKLKLHNINFPTEPDKNGTIINATEKLPKIGFWLMPNNEIDGMIEDLCLDMIDIHTRKIIEECVGISKEKSIASFKEVHYSKAILHSYLAVQDEPGRPIGQAITAQVLKSNTLTVQCFVDWLQKLFA